MLYLELARIGSLLFIFADSLNDQNGSSSSIDTFATRLSAQPLSGTTDPEVLAELARGRLRSKLPALGDALEGSFSSHHALMVGKILAHVDYLDESIGDLSDEVERVIAPFSEKVELLDTIPGVNRRMAETLIAEIGVDMEISFPLTSILPRGLKDVSRQNEESAGLLYARARPLGAPSGSEAR